MFWVPQSGDIGVGVSILSYAGGVQFGLITDGRYVPTRSRSSIALSPNSRNWCSRLCMLPWGQAVDADGAHDWLFAANPVRARSDRSKSSARMR